MLKQDTLFDESCFEARRKNCEQKQMSRYILFDCFIVLLSCLLKTFVVKVQFLATSFIFPAKCIGTYANARFGYLIYFYQMEISVFNMKRELDIDIYVGI